MFQREYGVPSRLASRLSHPANFKSSGFHSDRIQIEEKPAGTTKKRGRDIMEPPSSTDKNPSGLVSLDMTHRIWDRFFMVAPLVVIGTKGKSNLKYVLLGSTAERLLRDLPASVLAVKPGGA